MFGAMRKGLRDSSLAFRMTNGDQDDRLRFFSSSTFLLPFAVLLDEMATRFFTGAQNDKRGLRVKIEGLICR